MYWSTYTNNRASYNMHEHIRQASHHIALGFVSSLQCLFRSNLYPFDVSFSITLNGRNRKRLMAPITSFICGMFTSYLTHAYTYTCVRNYRTNV